MKFLMNPRKVILGEKEKLLENTLCIAPKCKTMIFISTVSLDSFLNGIRKHLKKMAEKQKVGDTRDRSIYDLEE